MKVFVVRLGPFLQKFCLNHNTHLLCFKYTFSKLILSHINIIIAHFKSKNLNSTASNIPTFELKMLAITKKLMVKKKANKL